MIRVRSLGFVICAIGFVGGFGCGSPAKSESPDTGAKDAVRTFFEAVISKDFSRAFEAAHPDSRKGVTAVQFQRRVETYCKSLGFEPAHVHVRTCEEHGTEANARVVISGPGAGKHQFKDAVIVRRDGQTWRVLVPQAMTGR